MYSCAVGVDVIFSFEVDVMLHIAVWWVLITYSCVMGVDEMFSCTMGVGVMYSCVVVLV